MNKGLLLIMAVLLFFFGCGRSQQGKLDSAAGLPGLSSGPGTLTAITPPAPPPQAKRLERIKSRNPRINGRNTSQIHLTSGWNTISFPFQSVTSTSGFTHYLYKFNGSGYDEIDALAQPESIDCCCGYWAYAENPCDVSVDGIANTSIYSTNLNYGWNMLGMPFTATFDFYSLNLTHSNQQSLAAASSLTIPPEANKWVYGTIYNYTSGGWIQQENATGTNQMCSTYGYWVWCWNNTGQTLFNYPPPRTLALSNDGRPFYGIWGSNANDIYLVRNSINILHYNGSAWRDFTINSIGSNGLMAIWGSSANDIFAVGTSGTIVHYNGTAWESMFSGTNYNLKSVWGSAANNVFAVGENGGILRYNGTSWRTMNSNTTQNLNDVWGSASNDVFAAGDGATVLYYNGSAWGVTTFEWGNFTCVWGTAANNVYAVRGDYWSTNYDPILHYNGNSWSPCYEGYLSYPSDIWGTSSNNFFVGLGYGGILHYNGTGWNMLASNHPGLSTQLHIWGSSPTDIYFAGGDVYDTNCLLHYDSINLAEVSSSERGNSYSDWQGNCLWCDSPNDIYMIGADIAHYNGTAWHRFYYNLQQPLLCIWGTGENDVFTVGWNGYILHYNGTAWGEMNSYTTNYLYGIWGSGPNNVYAVGGNGTIINYDGESWAAQQSPTTEMLTSIWGSGSDDIFAAGQEGIVLHYSGSSWSIMAGAPPLNFVWGTASNDVYGCDNHTVYHYNGSSWSSMASIYSNGKIWGSGPRDVYVCGGSGDIWHYDGSSWSNLFSVPHNDLTYGFWGCGTNHLFITNGGEFWHY